MDPALPGEAGTSGGPPRPDEPAAPAEPRVIPGNAPLAVGHESFLGREEAYKAVFRFRRALTAGYGIWIAFLAVDWQVSRHLGAGSFAHFVALRAVMIVAVLPVLIRLYRSPPPSARMLSAMTLCVYLPGAAIIGLMCVQFRGLASPYAPGICLFLFARALSSQDPWRRGLVMNAALVAGFYAVLLGGAVLSPGGAAQFHDPSATTLLLVNSAYILGSFVFLVIGGHIVWSLRNAVFEARVVGRYRLKRRIGGGAMGDVWLAYHPAIKRDIAIKILRPNPTDLLSIARFEREARATADLEHPNTVRVFDFGTTDDGLCFYAMELLSGETLADLVRREGPLPPERVVHLALQAARALGEAHRRGVVHRDVKPSNLFVTPFTDEPDFVKVLDFGLARLIRTEDRLAETLTKDGGFLGTPEYMSPEAVIGSQVDARADVYGMGGVLYFMLTGQSPFESPDARAIVVLLARVHNPPTKPSERLGRPLPSDLEGIVMHCLEMVPSARYADANELARVLADCLARGNLRPLADDPTQTAAER